MQVSKQNEGWGQKSSAQKISGTFAAGTKPSFQGMKCNGSCQQENAKKCKCREKRPLAENIAKKLQAQLEKRRSKMAQNAKKEKNIMHLHVYLTLIGRAGGAEVGARL